MVIGAKGLFPVLLLSPFTWPAGGEASPGAICARHRLLLVLRGGAGEPAGAASAVFSPPPARAALVAPDITKQVRIGGTNLSTSELAWAWGTGKERARSGGGPAAAAPAKSQAPREVQGTRRRRESWTRTEVIEGQQAPFLSNKVFLGGTGDLVEKDLWNYLEAQYGEVVEVDVIRQNDTPRGFAFAQFSDSSAAAQCIGAGSFVLRGQRVHVSPSDTEKPRATVARAPAHLRGLQFAGQEKVSSQSRTVFLGGTRQLTEGALLPVLQRYGEVTALHVVSRRENMLECAGFAFATFNTSAEARRLVCKGILTAANVTMEARFHDEQSRPGVSEKVLLSEVDELVAGLRELIEHTLEFAPGGYTACPAVEHEGIVFGAGTPFEAAFSQRIEASQEPLDEAGRSVAQLGQLLEDAVMLRTQVHDCLCTRLRDAAQRNDVVLLRHLVSLGASVNAPQRELSRDLGLPETLGRYDELAPRSLYLAAAQGHVDTCRVLLELGAEVDAVCCGEELEKFGSFVSYTPLKVAAAGGFLDVVKLLLDHAADVAFCDESKWSILHWAACNNHAGVVQALAAAGAHVNATNLHGRTPLSLALQAGAADAARALRGVGAAEATPGKRRRDSAARASVAPGGALAAPAREAAARGNSEGERN